jgi:hypothetical protein
MSIFSQVSQFRYLLFFCFKLAYEQVLESANAVLDLIKQVQPVGLGQTKMVLAC